MALKEVTTDSLDDILAEEVLEPFDLTELTLPRDYLIEVMAREALGAARTIQVVRMNITANKAVHNDAEVKRLADLEMAARLVLSKIKKEYPESLKRVAPLARVEADKGKLEGS